VPCIKVEYIKPEIVLYSKNIFKNGASVLKSLGGHPDLGFSGTSMVRLRMGTDRIQFQNNLFANQTILVNER